MSKQGVFINDMNDLRPGKIVSKGNEELEEAYPDLREEKGESIDRRHLQEVEGIYSDNDNKETDPLYQESEDGNMNNAESQNEMDQIHANPDYYDDAMNGPSQEPNQHPRRQAVNEFRICYSRPKFPRRNLTTERLAEPKKPVVVTNPFLYSDFRGMIHADNAEAIDNINGPQTMYGNGFNSRGFSQSDPFQTGMSQNLKGRKKFSTSVKEMFPMPEFNTYLSCPTKKKDRRKLKKPHTAAVGFRQRRFQPSMGDPMGDMGPTNDDHQKEHMSSAFSQTSTKNFGMGQTGSLSKRGMKPSVFDDEMNEIQESMKALDQFDQKHGEIKRKAGYPKIMYKKDMKGF
jgi:hypothetical protein